MKTLNCWSPALDWNVGAVEPGERDLIVSVDCRGAEHTSGRACCPVCGKPSSSRHSSYVRTLCDLSTQSRPVWILARLTRWRCRNNGCDRTICYRTRLTRFGGHGYGHIFANVVPMTRRRGFEAGELEVILVANARQLLAFV